MIGQEQLDQLSGSTVYDAEGAKIGAVKQVFVDDESGQPVIASVHTGLFGMSESFVPIHEGTLAEGRLDVPVDKATVKDAPRVDPQDAGGMEHISDEQLSELYQYYNLPYGGGRHDYNRADLQSGGTMSGQNPSRAQGADMGTGLGSGRRDVEPGTAGVAGSSGVPTPTDSGAPQAGFGAETAGEPAYAPTDRPAAGGMPRESRTGDELTRYEEQMHIGTEAVESGHVRLRKYVTTENVSRTVPVRHERVHVEREPIADGEVDPRHDFADETIEATLYEERPVVETEAVPVERVRLEKDSTTEDREVTGELRHEEIELDSDDDDRWRRESGS